MTKTYPPYICEDGTHYLFTDGSCHPNPGGFGGWAFCHVYNGRIMGSDYGGLRNTTTNVAELYGVKNAVIYGLKSIQSDRPIYIVTDSAYCFNGFNKFFRAAAKRGWVTANGDHLKNHQLIASTMAMLLPDRFVIDKVKGHNGNPWNEVADELAGDARIIMRDDYS